MADFNADNLNVDNAFANANSVMSFLANGNLLPNGRFEVWQRATSFAAPASVYTADRWKANGTGTVSRTTANGGMTIVGNATISHVMESIDYNQIAGKNVTLTWSQGGAVQSQTLKAASATIFSKAFTDTTLDWVWLSLGNTPAVNPVWQPYQMELAFCERYYQKITGRLYTTAFPGSAYVAYTQLFFKPMRAVPTATVAFSGGSLIGATAIAGSKVTSPITAVALQSRTNAYINITVTATSGTPLTATQTVLWVDTTWTIELVSEL
jgi:hypothetical protein